CQQTDQNNDSSSLDQIQSRQYPKIHHPSQADVEEVLHDREKFIQDTQTFLEKFNRFSFRFTPRVLTIAWERIDKIKYVLTKPEEIPELMYKLREDVRNIREELEEYIDSPIWNCPTFFYDADEEYTIQYREYLEKSPDAVTTILPTEEPEHSLSMGQCEVTSEDEIEYDKPAKDESSSIFTTFSNPLFNYNNDFTSSDDESLPDEDVPAGEFKIYSNPLFDEDEIKIPKFDFDFDEEIRHIENLLYDNSFPRPPEELNAQIANTIIESIPLPIPFRDEANLFLSNDLIPPGIENVADDPEGDVRFLEELLINDSILSHESYDSNFEDNPSILRPPSEPPDVESFFDLKPEVIAEEISDKLNEDKCFEPGREINVSTKIKDDDYFPFMFVI
nr:hypothetical protein [Tanacetum cinerariifolium]